MKKVITILLAIIAISTAVMAQVTDGFSYQAVVRNSSGQLMSNRNVGVRISIIKGTPDGSEVYNQTFTPTTNANGLFTIVIGGNAAFNSINWTTGPYFLHSEIDINGGTNYTLETVQQIHAVPYALHANVADSVSERFVLPETDPRFRSWRYEFDSLRNVPDFVTSGDLSITRHGDTIFLNNGSFIVLPNDLVTSIDWDSVINHPTKLSQFINDLGFLTHVGLVSWDSITGRPTNLSQFYNDLGFLTHVGPIDWDSIFNHPTNLSQFYNDLGFLTHVGLVSWDSIFNHPTNLSQFYNDLGFLTHVGPIDWDSIFNHPTNLSQFYNDLGFLTHVGPIDWDSIFNHPTNLSQFYNDLGFLTHVGPIDWDSIFNHPTNLSQFYNDLGFLTHVGLVSWDSITGRPTNLSQFYNDLGFLTHVGPIDWDSIFNHPTSLSQFRNDLGFLTHVGPIDWDSIFNHPTNLSQFYNDLGFLTTETQNLGDVLSINNSAQGMLITNLGTPINANDAANKIYVDNNINRVLDSLDALRDSLGSQLAGDIYNLGDSLVTLIHQGDSNLLNQITNLGDSIIDLNNRIDSLDNHIDSLDNRLDSLEQRVFALEHPVVRGALTGVFSVSNNSKIVFSQGNLMYRPSTLTWCFALNQYDNAGNNNIRIRNNCTYWIDLFGFGTSGWNSDAIAYQPYSTSTTDGEYMAAPNGNDLGYIYADADWGYYNPILNGGNQMGVWRTLSQAEWDYMLNIRPNSSNLKTLATVNNVPGLILLPDTWTIPDGITLTTSDTYSTNTYSAEQWTALENAGAVFLPAAGKRAGSNVSEVGSIGRYWTSSHVNSSNAYIVNVGENNVGITPCGASTGCSVRLVKNY